jgi:hypothetical protein
MRRIYAASRNVRLTVISILKETSFALQAAKAMCGMPKASRPFVVVVALLAPCSVQAWGERKSERRPRGRGRSRSSAGREPTKRNCNHKAISYAAFRIELNLTPYARGTNDDSRKDPKQLHTRERPRTDRVSSVTVTDLKRA